MPSKAEKAKDGRLAGGYQVPAKGVIGQGPGKREHNMLPDKDVTRDPKPGKAATWKTGPTG